VVLNAFDLEMFGHGLPFGFMIGQSLAGG